MSFKVGKNGMVKATVSKQLSKRQQLVIAKMNPLDANRYLSTILGLVAVRVPVTRERTHASKRDPLSMKQAGSNVIASSRSMNPSQDHKPLNIGLGDWIGVEIECFIPNAPLESRPCPSCEGRGHFRQHREDEEGRRVSVDTACMDCNGTGARMTVTRRNVNVMDLVKTAMMTAKLSRVSVKHDGSLADANGQGVEITVLYNAKLGHGKLKAVCDVLASLGAYVNRSCGLHVHLDHRTKSVDEVEAIGKRLGHALPILKFMVPESRRSNSYCRMGVSDVNGERYYAVNLTAFPKFQTIEIRLFGGTVNFDKIAGWVDLLRHLAKADGMTRAARSYQDFLDMSQLPDRLIGYVETRLTLFRPSLVSTNESAA